MDTCPSARPVRVRALSVHAHYRCAHSGHCCRAGWAIPVEQPVLAVLRRSLTDGTVSVARPGPALAWPADRPATAAAVLGRDTLGVCVFFDERQRGGSCRVHRHAGLPALPISCRQFPRIARHDARGVDVTLSHWCPTALAALEQDLPLGIVESPAELADASTYEGLDARTTWPPLLRPDCLFDHDAYTTLEHHVVTWLAGADASPWVMLEQVGHWWERLRSWRRSSDSLVTLVDRSADDLPGGTGPHWDVAAIRPVLRAALHDAVPADLRGELPGPPADASALDDVWAQESDAQRLAARYLAARFFGSWLAYQGSGLRSHLAGLGMVLAALEDGMSAASGTPLERVRAGVRAADLAALHLAVPDAVARSASHFERAAPSDWAHRLVRQRSADALDARVSKA